MLTIYGTKRSRALRCIWALEELGLSYEQVPVVPGSPEASSAEYRKLNPAAKVPTLVHDDFVLTETLAINLYLTTVFPGALLPRDPKLQARTNQWISWAATELEPSLTSIVREGRRPAGQADLGRISTWRADIERMLTLVLEPHLGRQTYAVVPDAFTLADLHLAATTSVVKLFDISLAPYPNTSAWLDRCLTRPAHVKAQQRQ
jgi:glutathione S-transferase